jgi:hypothetical protein
MKERERGRLAKSGKELPMGVYVCRKIFSVK